MTDLDRKIHQLSRRMRVVRMVYATTRVLFYAACVGVLILLIEKLFYANLNVWGMIAALAALSIPVGIAYAFLHRRTAYKAAVAADESQGLEERLSSAVLLKTHEREPMVGLLLADATSTARHVKPAKALPFRFSRETRWILAPIAALAILYFVPNFDILGREAQAKFEEKQNEEIKEIAEHLEPAVERLEKQAEKNQLLETEELAKELGDLKTRMQNNQVDRLESIAKLSSLTDKVEKVRKQYETASRGQRGIRKPDEMKYTRNLANALRKGDYRQAREELEKIEQNLAQNRMTEEEEGLLRKEMEELAKDMAAQNPKLSRALTSAAKEMESNFEPKKKPEQAEDQQQTAGANQQQQKQQQTAQNKQGQNQQSGQNQQNAGQQGQKKQGKGQQNQQQTAQNQQGQKGGGQQNQQGFEQAKQEMGKLARMAEDSSALREASSACKACKSGMSGKSGNASKMASQGNGQSGAAGQKGATRVGAPSKAGSQGSQGQKQGACKQCGSSSCSGGGQCSGNGLAKKDSQSSGAAKVSEWKAGKSQSMGNGMGGPGRGRGGAPDAPPPINPNFFDDRPDAPFDKDAELAASMPIDAEPADSEVTTSVVPNMRTYDQQAREDALAKEEVPVGYEDYVKNYFTTLDNMDSN